MNVCQIVDSCVVVFGLVGKAQNLSDMRRTLLLLGCLGLVRYAAACADQVVVIKTVTADYAADVRLRTALTMMRGPPPQSRLNPRACN